MGAADDWAQRRGCWTHPLRNKRLSTKSEKRERDDQLPGMTLCCRLAFCFSNRRNPVTKGYHSTFRKWFQDYLRPLEDRRTEWPQLLRLLLEEEFTRTRLDGSAYIGRDVFINRDKKASDHSKNHPKQNYEVIQAYSLYVMVHQTIQGLLRVG